MVTPDGERVSIEPVEFEVEGEEYFGRLNARDADADTGVVMLPGAGHGPFGDIFDIVAYEIAGTGKHVFRSQTWETREELEAKTLTELHAELDAAIERLQSRGCSTIQVVAKSYGGGIALTYVPDAVERLVLWAPAVDFGVAPDDANDSDEELGESDEFLVGIHDLDHVDVPVRILRGTEDKGISLDHCQRIADAVEDGDVTEIPDEDHSFNRNRPAIVEQTLDYLATES